MTKTPLKNVRVYNQGAWNLGVYAKNVFNTQKELNRYQLLKNIYAPYASADDGYDQVAYTTPREIGVILRHSFGSR